MYMRRNCRLAIWRRFNAYSAPSTAEKPAGLPAGLLYSTKEYFSGYARCQAKEKTGARARKERSDGPLTSTCEHAGAAGCRQPSRNEPAGSPAGFFYQSMNAFGGYARCQAKERSRSEGTARAAWPERRDLSFARQRNDFIELYADGDMKVP